MPPRARGSTTLQQGRCAVLRRSVEREVLDVVARGEDRPQLGERLALYLADAFLGDAETLADLCERALVFAQETGGKSPAVPAASGPPSPRAASPPARAKSCRSRTMSSGDGPSSARKSCISSPSSPEMLAFSDRSGWERCGFHPLDGGRGHAELARDPFALLVRHGRAGIVRELGAQPPEVEEQALLRRRRPDPDDGGVANDVFLDSRQDPPRRIGRETNLAFDVEAVGRLQQPDIAFLDQVAGPAGRSRGIWTRSGPRGGYAR